MTSYKGGTERMGRIMKCNEAQGQGDESHVPQITKPQITKLPEAWFAAGKMHSLPEKAETKFGACPGEEGLTGITFLWRRACVVRPSVFSSFRKSFCVPRR